MIGGFALVGSRYGIPDIGLAAFGEISSGIRDIMAATRLPVLVDGDTGYGDVKNVAHTIEGYEAMGAAAAGKITDADLAELEAVACPGAGACGGQYTANTMSMVPRSAFTAA